MTESISQSSPVSSSSSEGTALAHDAPLPEDEPPLKRSKRTRQAPANLTDYVLAVKYAPSSSTSPPRSTPSTATIALPTEPPAPTIIPPDKAAWTHRLSLPATAASRLRLIAVLYYLGLISASWTTRPGDPPTTARVWLLDSAG